jgi:NTP pyrophosphatase (non-canonical NTP hydrolase)
MNLAEYQAMALETDQTKLINESEAKLVPLLGLAGEAGQLLSEYKKRLRDGEKHEKFVDRVSEELGDILWYVANVASKYDLSLDSIAEANLAKTRARYQTPKSNGKLDERYGEIERFPRKFNVTFQEKIIGPRAEVTAFVDGRVIGATLTDNSYADDGYRFHDVFHVAYAAVLGWSPVLRKLMQRKRRSDPRVDEVEDGGRAGVIEEGIAALTFDYARRHKFLDGVHDIDADLIRTIRDMSGHLEVSCQPESLWRKAILEGFSAWRNVVAAGGGTITADLDSQTVTFTPYIERPIATAAADVSA